MSNPAKQSQLHRTPSDGLISSSLPDIADTVNGYKSNGHRRQRSAESLQASMGRDFQNGASTTVLNALASVDRSPRRNTTLRSSPRFPDNHVFPVDSQAQLLQTQAAVERQRRRSSERLAEVMPSVFSFENADLRGESSTDLGQQRTDSYLKAQQTHKQKHLTHELNGIEATSTHPGVTVTSSASNSVIVDVDRDNDDSSDSDEMSGEVSDSQLEHSDDESVDPMTVRLVHHVKIEHQREYEKFLMTITEIAYRSPDCAGVTTMPIHYSRNTRWMVILRFLNQAAYLKWRKDSHIARLLKELRKKKIFDMHPKEKFKAEVYVGWNVMLTQDAAHDDKIRNRLLSQGYPKYRYIFVLILSFWLANTLLSIEDNGPDRSYSSYRRALVSYLKTDDGHAENIVWLELLFVLVAAPFAYFVFAPIFTMLMGEWLKRPVPPEPEKNFLLYAVYRVFVTS
eukprot:TRINITY_DN1108_c0_g1_i1.p1 TRINITY_DN1108_c0_g1~~TRINITY_DN1108_c0_g1_i1.p1  ORF type:complete len:454 (+),score=120.27 TRINITY_DN1108_c0_g1_i1:189-1550(+)